jgi:hypothetical protein
VAVEHLQGDPATDEAAVVVPGGVEVPALQPVAELAARVEASPVDGPIELLQSGSLPEPPARLSDAVNWKT